MHNLDLWEKGNGNAAIPNENDQKRNLTRKKTNPTRSECHREFRTAGGMAYHKNAWNRKELFLMSEMPKNIHDWKYNEEPREELQRRRSNKHTHHMLQVNKNNFKKKQLCATQKVVPGGNSESTRRDQTKSLSLPITLGSTNKKFFVGALLKPKSATILARITPVPVLWLIESSH